MKKNNPSRDPQNVNDDLWYYEGKREFTLVIRRFFDTRHFPIPFADVDKLATMLRESVARMTAGPAQHEIDKLGEKIRRRMTMFNNANIYRTVKDKKDGGEKLVKIPTPVDYTARPKVLWTNEFGNARRYKTERGCRRAIKRIGEGLISSDDTFDGKRLYVIGKREGKTIWYVEK